MADTNNFHEFLNEPGGLQSSSDFNQITFGGFSIPDRPPGDITDDARKNVLLTTQLLVAVPLGTIFFLAFCYFRTRWNTMFAPRSRLQKLAPDPLPATFFGWIIPLYNMPESHILEKVGLDAAVLLAFFKMSYKLFSFCAIVGFVIMGPIKFAEYIDLLPGKNGDKNKGNNYNGPAPLPIEEEPETPAELVSYAVFTWIFTLATFYYTFYNYREFSDVRHRYYLKWKDTITARTVMVTVIPKKLQNCAALAEFYESLGLGAVESAVVYRHVRKLRHIIEKRVKYLSKLEEAYVDYLGNPCKDPDYDPDLASSVFEKADDAKTANERAATVLQKVEAKRPTKRRIPLFGKKIDKIEYYTEKFFEYDELVEAGRRGAYESVPIGFVTFDNIASAQLAAQVLIYPEPFECQTELAPEPRDVYWYNMTIQSREFFVRTLIVNIMIVILAFFWSGPILAFASLLSMQTLERFFPWLAHIAEKSEIIRGFIQGTLPTLAVSIFNILLPKIMIGLTVLQGFKARSVIELSTFAKYYFFLLVNVLLVFSIVGSVFKNFEDIIKNPTGTPHKLATTLPQVSSFFVNFVVFQGIGVFPIHLLQLKEVAYTWTMRILFSKTPRDYATASAPPFMNYGEELPPMVLIFVIVMVYSSLRPMAITFFGAIYFFLGYMCYKYLLLYVYFHPYETAGNAWPKIFRRIIIGLYIYQILMIGYLSLRNCYYYAASISPLLIFTFYFFYYVNDAYERAAAFVPLKSLRDELKKVQTDTSDVVITPKAPETPSNSGSTSNVNEPPATTVTEDPEEGHSHRDVLEDDLYHADPDLYTDYSQPPMTLYDGVLNTGMRNYGPPALVGVLPWLWLPVKRVPTGEAATTGVFHRLLGMNKSGYKSLPNRSVSSLAETEEERHQIDLRRQEDADAKIKLATKRTAKDPNNPNKIYYHHPERRRSTLVSPISPPDGSSNNILDTSAVRTSSPDRSGEIPSTSTSDTTSIEIPGSANLRDRIRAKQTIINALGRFAGNNFG